MPKSRKNKDRDVRRSEQHREKMGAIVMHRLEMYNDLLFAGINIDMKSPNLEETHRKYCVENYAYSTILDNFLGYDIGKSSQSENGPRTPFKCHVNDGDRKFYSTIGTSGYESDESYDAFPEIHNPHRPHSPDEKVKLDLINNEPATSSSMDSNPVPKAIPAPLLPTGTDDEPPVKVGASTAIPEAAEKDVATSDTNTEQKSVGIIRDSTFINSFNNLIIRSPLNDFNFKFESVDPTSLPSRPYDQIVRFDQPFHTLFESDDQEKKSIDSEPILLRKCDDLIYDLVSAPRLMQHRDLERYICDAHQGTSSMCHQSLVRYFGRMTVFQYVQMTQYRPRRMYVVRRNYTPYDKFSRKRVRLKVFDYSAGI